MCGQTLPCTWPAPALTCTASSQTMQLIRAGDSDCQAAPEAQATAFRSWTCPPPGEGHTAEPVPGLRDLLRSVGLFSYCDLAESWCREAGAAFLAELADDTEVQALADALDSAGGLASTAYQRLVHALQATRGATQLGGHAMTTGCDGALLARTPSSPIAPAMRSLKDMAARQNELGSVQQQQQQQWMKRLKLRRQWLDRQEQWHRHQPLQPASRLSRATTGRADCWQAERGEAWSPLMNPNTWQAPGQPRSVSRRELEGRQAGNEQRMEEVGAAEVKTKDATAVRRW